MLEGNNKITCPRAQKNRLSEQELIAMEKEIQEKYIRTVWSERFQMEIKPMDITQYLKDKGALSASGAVIIHRGKMVQYEQVSADLEQFFNWKAKKEYGDKKKMEQLMEMSKEIGH